MLLLFLISDDSIKPILSASGTRTGKQHGKEKKPGVSLWTGCYTLEP